MSVPAKKYELIEETEHRIVAIENEYKMGFMTNDERYRAPEALSELLDHLTVLADLLHPDALVHAAVVLPDDDLLGHVH